MALDTALLKPAQIGTSEIATKNDISTSLGAYNPATVINTNTTTINGGKITTGSITAGQIAANSLTTAQLSTNIALINGSVYSSGFLYPTGTITGTPSGFRLSATAAGTGNDPTIYGAYIKGGTLDGGIINVKNLQTINDAGFYTRALFSSGQNSSGQTSIYAYNSNDNVNTKLGSYTNTIIVTGTIYTYLTTSGGFESDAITAIIPGVALCSIGGNATFNVYLGNDLLGSYYISSTNTVSFSIAGINFYCKVITGYMSSLSHVTIDSTNTISISGSGVLRFTLTSGSNVATHRPITILVNNL